MSPSQIGEWSPPIYSVIGIMVTATLGIIGELILNKLANNTGCIFILLFPAGKDK